MGIFATFEALMTGIVEGSFGRIFRTRLQPVELARKLERTMELDLTVNADRRVAPNLYEVYLSPRDHAQFASHARSLVQQLSEHLIAVARARGYMLTSRPLVRFHEDDHMITGQVRIETQLLEPQSHPGGTGSGAEAFGGLEATRSMTAEEARELAQQMQAAQAVPETPIPPAWLTLVRPSRGQPMRLEKSVIHVGRHLDNDVVVNDRRVSRYHAEIRCEHGQFVVYDLGSTNGVKINGVATRQAVPLRDNDVLTVGNHEFVFQRR